MGNQQVYKGSLTNNSLALFKGPQGQDLAACDQFRKFFGDLSELRKFSDGTTREVVDFEEAAVNLGVDEKMAGDLNKNNNGNQNPIHVSSFSYFLKYILKRHLPHQISNPKIEFSDQLQIISQP